MRLFILLSFMIGFLMSDSQLISNIDKTLQKVINESKTKTLSDIKIDYDPFNTNKPKPGIKQVQKDEPSKPQPQIDSNQPLLSMIFNKKAFINGKWYKENEKFADYVITKINQDIVVLKKKNRYTTLKLPMSNTILITKEGIR